jgi:DNA-binding NtrC family response regulator
VTVVAVNVPALVLVVDDEIRMAAAVSEALSLSGCECLTCSDAQQALTLLAERHVDAVVTDWRMPGMDGLQLLRRVQSARPGTPVLLLTAYGDIPSAVAAMREGAFDYLTKPFDNDELRSRVARALEVRTLRRENRLLRQELDSHWAADVVAESGPMRAILDLVRRVAATRSPVLIQGESGTGKEVLARLVHVASDRLARPFVAVNCKAFSDSILESELFGHEKGSFTGATATHIGCFERANGGSLFLDEIGEVNPSFQVKLLRVLQEGEVLRLGGQSPRRIDVRIIAATNRDLRAELQAGRFREDLFFRLNVIPITVPPLRDRRPDILPIARHFLDRHVRASGRPMVLTEESQARLVEHHWAGNVRELQNAIERAVILARGDAIGPEDLLLDDLRPDAAGTFAGSLQHHLDKAAADRIRAALESTQGRRSAAAAALGIDRTTLFRWMKRLGIDASDRA